MPYTIERAVCMAVSLFIATGAASASERVEGLIVKLRPSAAHAVETNIGAKDIEGLNRVAGTKLAHARAMSGGAHVLRLAQPLGYAEAQALAARVAADPAVEYAVPDRRVYPLQIPTDVNFSLQWNLGVPLAGQMGINAPAAWDISTGANSVVVAVLDTGLAQHGDIDSDILDGSGQVVPGYDFVSDTATANDGGGRDTDPRDPGDWVTSAESASGTFAGCPVASSSWHGTHVAGIVGALSNNATGVAGVAWDAKVLPVRVMGKCGGVLSDILDGVRWAAGLSVSGVASNPNPAKVINLSLGGGGACSAAEQAAINDAVNAGAVVVVAAGNSNANVATTAPANCANVIAVAASTRDGGRAGYSNFGSLIDIAAPGGAQITRNDASGIMSTLNTGTQGPASDDYVFYQGTSMATPHVAGVAALMLAVEPTLTPAQLESMLRASARAFPSGSSCTTAICGAGLLDAHAAVVLAQQNQPVVEIRVADGSGAEPSDALSFTVTRVGSTTANLTVQYTVGGSATAGSDYAGLSGSVTIPAGASTATVVVTPLDDSAAEGTETVALTLQSGSAYVVGMPDSASVDLVDNDVAAFADGGGGCAIGRPRGLDPLWLGLLLWPLWRRLRRQARY